MTDPLSSLASVITIVGSATKSIEVLVEFFRQFRNASAEVHQWLTMLQSLSSTLSALQQCGQNLNTRYRFSSNFRQRLLSCVTQLQICIDEVAKTDSKHKSAGPDGKKRLHHKARRSWEKAKWAILGDLKIKKLMKTLDLYQFEFVMELLKMLM